MQVTILKPAKSAMQSGLVNTKHWVIKFPADNTKEIEKVMGWVSSSDTMQEVQLKFETKEEAINYAKKNHLDYQVIQPHEKKFTIRTYAENFK